MNHKYPRRRFVAVLQHLPNITKCEPVDEGTHFRWRKAVANPEVVHRSANIQVIAESGYVVIWDFRQLNVKLSAYRLEQIKVLGEQIREGILRTVRVQFNR